MIRMFYYHEVEFSKQLQLDKFHLYSEVDFENLMNWQYDKNGNAIKPFRDEHSIKFLKDTFHIEFLSENDWYSVKSPKKSKFSLAGLSQEVKYGLVLLHYAKLGRILSFQPCSDIVWKVLSDMPFDIFIVVNASEIKYYDVVRYAAGFECAKAVPHHQPALS